VQSVQKVQKVRRCLVPVLLAVLSWRVLERLAVPRLAESLPVQMRCSATAPAAA